MSNPVIERVVGELAYSSDSAQIPQRPLTLDAVINKTLFTAIALGVAAFFGWTLAPALGYGAILSLALVGIALGFINSFSKIINPTLVVIYAIVQGLFAGAISFNLNNMYPGIAQQAFLAASVTFGTVLVLYATRIIKSGPKFLRFLQLSIISYVVFALISFGSALFGLNDGWGLYGGRFGLVFAAIGVGLATLALVADFAAIEAAISYGADESYSWRLAFGLTVTFVWLYIELIRFLALLARSNE